MKILSVDVYCQFSFLEYNIYIKSTLTFSGRERRFSTRPYWKVTCIYIQCELISCDRFALKLSVVGVVDYTSFVDLTTLKMNITNI